MLDKFVQIFITVDFYVAILRMATPLLLAAIGGLVAEKAGIVTFSMESMMLMGTIAAIVGSGLSDNVWVGVLLALLGGMLIALVYAFMAVTIGAHQIVTSVALNLGMLGLSSILYALAFTRGDEIIQQVIKVPGLEVVKIPLLGDIPIIGAIFFNHYPLVYVAYVSVPLVWYVLYRTSWGLKIRAVGEHPHAADTVGINVHLVRYLSLMVTGALSGLAGAFLSVGLLNSFMENMTGGRGFIAYTSIVFGKWEPGGVLLGTLLFGAADALQLRIQPMGLNIPPQFMTAFPYVVTLLILILVVGKASWPASSGQAFRREGK